MKRKVALVHDWLTGMRGGEKVLDVFCDLFPDADVFTLVHAPGKVSPSIESHRIITSPLQKFPGVHRYYRHLLPLMPWAIEHFDFSAYDLIISSSHCVAKGAKPSALAKHWCYCHTPMRYIWDQYAEYFGPNRASAWVRQVMTLLRPFFQQWDRATVSRVHQFIANSRNVQERIKRLYHRDSLIVYPPVDYAFYAADPGSRPIEDRFFLIVSALVPYKRVNLAIEVFNELGLPLIVIGDGPEKTKLEAVANANIRFLGWLSNEQLRQYYAYCEALVFPGEEDFGIVPLEAMAAGRPVLAYQKGGALETVLEGETGLFFNQQTSEALKSTVQIYQRHAFDRSRIQAWAKSFDRPEMIRQLRTLFVEYADEMS